MPKESKIEEKLRWDMIWFILSSGQKVLYVTTEKPGIFSNLDDDKYHSQKDDLYWQSADKQKHQFQQDKEKIVKGYYEKWDFRRISVVELGKYMDFKLNKDRQNLYKQVLKPLSDSGILQRVENIGNKRAWGIKTGKKPFMKVMLYAIINNKFDEFSRTHYFIHHARLLNDILPVPFKDNINELSYQGGRFPTLRDRLSITPEVFNKKIEKALQKHRQENSFTIINLRRINRLCPELLKVLIDKNFRNHIEELYTYIKLNTGYTDLLIQEIILFSYSISQVTKDRKYLTDEFKKMFDDFNQINFKLITEKGGEGKAFVDINPNKNMT